MDLADYLSIGGTISAFLLSFAPLHPFIKVWKKEEKIDIIPEAMIFSLLFSRILWGCVWFLTNRKIALFNIIIGVTINNIFCFVYFYLYFDRKLIKGFFSSVFLIFIEAATIQLNLLWGDYITISYIGMVLNIIRYISPAQKILRVIKEKNYKLIPILSVIANLFCSVTWLGYGICINLPSQMIPNGIGLFFSIVNIFSWLYFYYNRKEDKKDEKAEDKKGGEVELIEK